jgi:hypothetical protein
MTRKRENEKTVVHEVSCGELAKVEGGVRIPSMDGCGHTIGFWHGKEDPPPQSSQAGWLGL